MSKRGRIRKLPEFHPPDESEAVLKKVKQKSKKTTLNYYEVKIAYNMKF
jgi:hypothetical protein